MLTERDPPAQQSAAETVADRAADPPQLGEFFAIFADGAGRRLPKIPGGPPKVTYYSTGDSSESTRFATVISPSMFALLYPLKDPVQGYSREEFEEDLVQECVTSIRQAFEAGAARVSIDFTEGRLATREDPHNPWTHERLLPHFIDLNNRVLAHFSDDERQRIGISTSPSDPDAVHSADVPYTNLLPDMFKINAGYFLIELASERDQEPVIEAIGQYSRDDQRYYLSVTSQREAEAGSARGEPSRLSDAIHGIAFQGTRERLGGTHIPAGKLRSTRSTPERLPTTGRRRSESNSSDDRGDSSPAT